MNLAGHIVAMDAGRVIASGRPNQVRNDPAVYYALGRAYARAGRTEDAERAREMFKRLSQEKRP